MKTRSRETKKKEKKRRGQFVPLTLFKSTWFYK